MKLPAVLLLIFCATLSGCAGMYEEEESARNALVPLVNSTHALAQAGDAAAQLRMCTLFYDMARNEIVDSDAEKAYEWCLFVAKKGNPKAQYLTGNLLHYTTYRHATDKYFPSSEAKFRAAIKWYRLAEQNGYTRATKPKDELEEFVRNEYDDSDDTFGKILAGVAVGAIVSGADVSSEAKIKAMSAFTADVASDGKTNATATLLLQQQAEQAQQRAIEQQNALRAERQREDELRAQRNARQSQLLAQQERQQYEQEADSRRRAQQLADEQRRKEQVAAQEAARQQQAAASKAREIQIEQARQDRLAKQEAEKAAKTRAESDYLAEVRRQFRLVARTCPDGEGKYYAVGINPDIKPKVVACYGIKFRAQCMGGGISAYGGTSHFASMSTSCFAGEAVPMAPKLNCKPEDVQITVTEVTPC
jgi:chemotaxis protein histidine kinase CheA